MTAKREACLKGLQLRKNPFQLLKVFFALLAFNAPNAENDNLRMYYYFFFCVTALKRVVQILLNFLRHESS